MRISGRLHDSSRFAILLFALPSGSVITMNTFIANALQTNRPDLWLGLLQTVFIIGLSIACPIVASYSRKRSPLRVIAAGIGVWIIGGVCLCR